jgi:hypothetical protein
MLHLLEAARPERGCQMNPMSNLLTEAIRRGVTGAVRGRFVAV